MRGALSDRESNRDIDKIRRAQNGGSTEYLPTLLRLIVKDREVASVARPRVSRTCLDLDRNSSARVLAAAVSQQSTLNDLVGPV